MTNTTATQINGHFVNTCTLADLDFIAQYLQVTPAQMKKALLKGQANLRAVIGTKLGNTLAGLNVEYITLDGLPSNKAPKAETPKANPFKASASGASKSGLTGAYTVGKVNAQPMENAEKAAMHAALLASATFAEFFAAAPAKAVVGKSIVTPSSMARAYIKRGWIIPAAA